MINNIILSVLVLCGHIINCYSIEYGVPDYSALNRSLNDGREREKNHIN